MIRDYLFRLICAGILSSAVLSVPLQKPIRRVLSLACGCVLVLLTLSPLLSVDLSTVIRSLPSVFDGDISVQTEKNDKLLQELICTQTEELIVKTAAEHGIRAEAEITVRYDETIGSYLPYSATVTVYESGASTEELRQFLTDDLAIPEARQTWILK